MVVLDFHSLLTCNLVVLICSLFSSSDFSEEKSEAGEKSFEWLQERVE